MSECDNYLLKQIINHEKVFPAPTKTLRQGEHYEFLVGINKDETVRITMTKEGYDSVMEE